jgi:hypothetical protein
MIVKVYHSIYWCIPLYTSDYPVQQMEVRVANLYSGSMEAPFGHIKGIASGPHYASEKLRLPFHTSEGSQGAIHNMGLQDMIELCWMESSLCLEVPSYPPCLESPSRPEGSRQSNPHCQLGGQPAQGRVRSPVNILQPLWGICCSFWQGHNGGEVLCKLNSAGLEKVDVETHTTT